MIHYDTFAALPTINAQIIAKIIAKISPDYRQTKAKPKPNQSQAKAALKSK